MVKLPLTPGSTRKDYPLYSGLLSYFPNALAYVSYVSKVANDQHNPGEPLHWAREKSTDHADCLLRHLLNKGQQDEDGVLETGKVAWRALALLEEELELLRNPLVAVDTTGPLIWPEEKPKTLYNRSKYDWSKAPEWAMWAATGWARNGVLCWFEHKPVRSGCFWTCFSGRWLNDYSVDGTEDYANSLEARPS